MNVGPILLWMAANMDVWRGPAVAVLALIALGLLAFAAQSIGDL